MQRFQQYISILIIALYDHINSIKLQNYSRVVQILRACTENKFCIALKIVILKENFELELFYSLDNGLCRDSMRLLFASMIVVVSLKV